RNLASNKNITVVDNGSLVSAPSIDGNLIAWEGDENGDFDIFVYRIDEGKTFQITDHPAHQILNNVFEDFVSYVDLRDGSDVYVSFLEFIPEDPCGELGGDTDEDGVCDHE